jgi:alpha-L-arabinofuranosidase
MVVLSQDVPDQRFLLYWLYYYFNRHVGARVLAINGTAPYYAPPMDNPLGFLPGPLTPALATISADGNSVYLVIANASWDRTVPCLMHIRHFAVGSAKGVVLSQNDENAPPLVAAKENVIHDYPAQVDNGVMICQIPPHSVVFVTLRKK